MTDHRHRVACAAGPGVTAHQVCTLVDIYNGCKKSVAVPTQARLLR